MSIVSFYPRAIEKTSLIYRSLLKKDLKYTSWLIIVTCIASPLIRDIGFAAVSATKWFPQLFKGFKKRGMQIVHRAFRIHQGTVQVCFLHFRRSSVHSSWRKPLLWRKRFRNLSFWRHKCRFQMPINKADGSPFRPSDTPFPRIALLNYLRLSPEYIV